LLCQSGHRATLAAEQLEAAGLDNAVVVDGGLNAWAAAGLPLVQSRRPIVPPVQNQIQMLVGFFLVAVSVLGLEVHPVWFLLTPLVGVGLDLCRNHAQLPVGALARPAAVESL
jgi:hypothetical protein